VIKPPSTGENTQQPNAYPDITAKELQASPYVHKVHAVCSKQGISNHHIGPASDKSAHPLKEEDYAIEWTMNLPCYVTPGIIVFTGTTQNSYLQMFSNTASNINR